MTYITSPGSNTTHNASTKNITNTNNTNLVDIGTIAVDKDLPQYERCAEFKRQIKDMNNYKSGSLTVRAVYANNGASIEDCLRGMMA